MPEFDKCVGKNARLTGRALQPWRAVLAVAEWLDKNGVTGLWERMEKLSVDYQNERPDLESFDLTALTIRALMDCAVANVTNATNVANHTETPTVWEFTTSRITEAAKTLADDSDGDIDPEKVTSQRIGQYLKRMRLMKPPRPRGQKSRIWRVTLGELTKWSLAYGLPMPTELANLIIPLSGIGNIGNIGYATVPSSADGDLLEGEI
jgi:hypothetical protein